MVKDIGKKVIAHIDEFRYEGVLLEDTQTTYVLLDERTGDKVKVPKIKTTLKVKSSQDDKQEQ